jgi:hypothetical protein
MPDAPPPDDGSAPPPPQGPAVPSDPYLWLDPDSGKVAPIDPDDLPAAYARGWKPAAEAQIADYYRQQKYGGGIEQAKTFAGTALEAFADAHPGQLVGPERVLANPQAAKWGEVTGKIAQGVAATTVAGGLLGVAEKAGAAAAEAIPRGGVDTFGTAVARNALSRAASGSVDAGIFEGTQIVHEAALGDPKLTAENIAVRMGMAMLSGGAAGGILGAAEVAVPTAVSRAKQSMDGIIGWAKSPKVQAALSGQPEEKIAEYQGLFDAGVDPAAIKRQAAALADQTQDAVDSMKSAHSFANEIRRQEASNLIESLNQETSMAGAQKQVQELTDQAKGLLETMQARPAVYNPTTVGKFEDGFKIFTEDVQAAKSPAEINAVMDDFKRFTQDRLHWGGRNTALMPDVQEAERAIKGFGVKLRTSLEDESVWGQAGARQAAFNSKESAWFKSNAGLNQFWGKKLKADGSVVMDPGKWSTAATGDPAGKQLAMEAYSNWHRDSLAYLEEITNTANNVHVPTSQLDPAALQDLVNNSAKVAQRISQSQRMAVLSKELGSTPTSGLADIAMDQAMGGPFFGPIATGLRLFRNLGNVPKTVAMLTKLQGLNKSVGSAVENNIGSIFSLPYEKGIHAAGVAAGAPPEPKISPAVGPVPPLTRAGAVLASRLPDVTRLSNPDALIDHVQQLTGPIAAHAPATAQALATTASAAATYMGNLIPVHNLPGIQQNKWVPSSDEIYKFNEAYDILHKPMNLLAKTKDGSLTMGEVRALQTVYPTWFSNVQAKVGLRLASHDKPLPTSTIAGLSRLMGAPATAHGSPGYGRASQAVYASGQPPPGPPQPTGRGSPAAGKVTMGDRLRTATEESSERAG